MVSSYVQSLAPVPTRRILRGGKVLVGGNDVSFFASGSGPRAATADFVQYYSPFRKPADELSPRAEGHDTDEGRPPTTIKFSAWAGWVEIGTVTFRVILSSAVEHTVTRIW